MKLVGTCEDMCPEYERVEREVQKELDRFELVPGTTQADPHAAVKIYRRPAAGRELPLPEEVRPPRVLEKTLDYLVHSLLPADPRDPQLAAVQPFLWNRTRAIRQDFIVQSDRGATAIACHERIARYHILCLHYKGGIGAEAWSEQQELEQLRKTLRSLIEDYDDQRLLGHEYPNEAEFRAYNLLLHVRDPESLRELELLPEHVFSAAPLQRAMDLQRLVQRSNLLEKRGNPRNTEATPNFFTQFFRRVRAPELSYLMACLAENLFPNVRVGAIKALARAYLPQHHGLPIPYVVRLLGMDHDEEAIAFLKLLHVEVDEHERVAKINRSVVLDENKSFMSPFSETIVEAKRGSATCQEIIDGRPSPPAAPVPARSPAPAPVPKGKSPPAAPVGEKRGSTAPVPAQASDPAPKVPAFSFKTPQLPPAPTPMPAPAPQPAPKPTPSMAPDPSWPALPTPAPQPWPSPKPAPTSAALPATPAPPAKPRIPRAQLLEKLTTRACTAVATDAVQQAAAEAMERERHRRRRVQRTLLLDDLVGRLTTTLLRQPVAVAVHTAATTAAVTIMRQRCIQRHAWTHWRAILAKRRERHAQARRLAELRGQLPELRISRADKTHSGTARRAPRLSDAQHEQSYAHMQHASARLWARATFAESIVDRVTQLAHDTGIVPLSWTAAVYVNVSAESGAGARWIRHKMGLSTDESSYTTDQGILVRFVDGLRAPDIVRDAQLVICEEGASLPVPARPTPLLLLSWTADASGMPRTLSAKWTPRAVVTLHDPGADPDTALTECLPSVVPALDMPNQRSLPLQRAIEPLWQAWCEIAEAIDTLVSSGDARVAHRAFVALTDLANFFLTCLYAANRSDAKATSVLLALPSADESAPDTLCSSALEQLQHVPWADDDALRLLRAYVLEQSSRERLRLSTYFQHLLSMAVTYWSATMQDTMPIPEHDVQALRSRGACVLAALAADVDRPRRRAPLHQSPVVQPKKRTSTPPTHSAKRGREDDTSARLRDLLHRSVRLLETPVD